LFNPYIWLMSFGHMVVDATQGVLPIITPLLAEKLNLTFFQVGIIALASTFSSAIIQPVLGVLSDRYSMSWLMPLGLFVSGLGLSLAGVVNSYGLLLLVVMLSGIGVAGYHPEGSKLTYLVSEEDKAGISMSIFSVGGNLGLGIGPVMATFLLGFSGLDSIYGVLFPGLLASFVFLYLLPRFNRILKDHLHEEKIEEERIDTKSNQKVKTKKFNLFFLLLYVAVRSWVHSGLVYFIPFYFPKFKGIAEPEYLVSIFLIAGVVGTLLGGPFSDRFGGRKGLLLSMVVSLLAVYPFMYFSGYWIPIFAFIAGTALVSTFSVTVVFGQRLLPDNIGLASGLVLGFAVGMGSIGVSVLGVVADHFGLPFVMNILCLLPLAGIAIAFVLPDDQGEFK
jgi:FSR family fosmidomycin resistance protein-like MFS transporter